MARLFVAAGTSVHERGGDRSSPRLEYFFGMLSPSAKAVEVSFIVEGRMVR